MSTSASTSAMPTAAQTAQMAQQLNLQYFSQRQAPPGNRVYDINSLIGGMVDRGAWKYWDTINITQGTTLPQSLSLFAVQIGATDAYNATRKTYLQTNMQLAGQFPPPRCLVLEQLGVFFSDMLLADIQAICQNYYMQFVIDNKVFFEGRIEFFPAGYGIFGNSTNAGEATWGLGFPAPQATVRYGRYSKYIAPQQIFSWTLICPGTPPTLASTAAGGTNLSMVGFMDGVTDRSVQ